MCRMYLQEDLLRASPVLVLEMHREPNRDTVSLFRSSAGIMQWTEHTGNTEQVGCIRTGEKQSRQGDLGPVGTVGFKSSKGV